MEMNSKQENKENIFEGEGDLVDKREISANGNTGLTSGLKERESWQYSAEVVVKILRALYRILSTSYNTDFCGGFI